MMKNFLAAVCLSVMATGLLGASGSQIYIVAGGERAELARHATEPFQSTAKGDAPDPMAFKLNYGNMGTHVIKWGLRGENAPTIVHTKNPSFLIGFGAMPGVDWSQYVPVLLRLDPYVDPPSQQRGRTGSTTTLTYTSKGPKLHFSDSRIETNVTVNGGQAAMKPVGPLDPGQYAIVLRPLHEESITAGTGGYEAMVAGSAGGSVQPWQWVWDFTVAY